VQGLSFVYNLARKSVQGILINELAEKALTLLLLSGG
jgi:hypothetical protein